MTLACKEHPERYLCPYVPARGSLNPGHDVRPGGQRPPKKDIQVERDGVPSEPPSGAVSDASISPDQPKQLDKSGKSTNKNDGGNATEGRARITKQKDPKSFAQSLFDTKAVKSFYTGLMPADPLTFCSNQGSGLETKLKRAERLNTSCDGSTTDQSNRSNKHNSAYHRDVPRISNTKPPQSLSYFSFENVRALYTFTCASMVKAAKEQRGDSSALTPTDVIEVGFLKLEDSPLASFIQQSIVYILSEPANLLRSFRKPETTGTPADVDYSIGFHEMVQSFCYLNQFNGHPEDILSSLSVACTSLYTSFRKGKLKQSLGISNKEALQISVNDDPFCAIGKVQYEYDAAHIAQIVFAALVARIPPCSISTFRLVEGCHNQHITIDAVRDPVVIRAVQRVLDAFDDEAALSLLANLVKALSTRISVIEVLDRARASDDEWVPRQTNTVTDYLLSRLLDSESNPFACSVENRTSGLRELLWIHASPWPPGSSRIPCPTYIVLVIQWLKYLVVKEWDGKPGIDRLGAVGGALEVLWHFRKSVESSQIRTPSHITFSRCSSARFPWTISGTTDG